MLRSDDSSLLSFYYISQSSQKIPYQKGIKDYQSAMAKPKKHPGTALRTEFFSGDPEYGVQGKENAKSQKDRLREM